ncbi:hypothetical protein ACFXPN_27835 [Streptomyces griseorubiginosus]|uniref:hypothetical protein n=1 Tax=Streptomyces griseorubiginosus TaxID=67304 RepID=UPI0036BA540E
MRGVRVVVIGGTSNTGKSTVAGAVAERLGFAHRSTDLLARHPGRPWRTPEREVPPHVAEHYATPAVDELIDSVLGHYERFGRASRNDHRARHRTRPGPTISDW